jgi:hypothetical protein
MNTNASPTLGDLGRAARNRANAVHSTGPKTEGGKKRSCLNAMRHGLTGHTVVLPPEDFVGYQDFTCGFFTDLKPVGMVERQLVQSLADTSWRLNRIPALVSNRLALGFDEHPDSISTEHPEANAALVTIEAVREETRALTALSQHGARLSRQFEKTLNQLRELQKERSATAASHLREAAALFQIHKNKEIPYHPPDDGFVLSNAEIETFISRRDRLKAAAA